MTIELPNSITQYFPYLPELFTALLIAFLITPLIGKFARKYHFLDLPSISRGRTDNTKDRRIHKKAIPRLGGLAVIIAFFATIAIYDNVPSEIVGVLIGMIIITFSGLLDDKLEISGKQQILYQIIAAVIVIISGVTVQRLTIAGLDIDLVSFTQKLSLFGGEYLFRFPADFLTLFWIILVTNALAWVCGIDALGESMTFIASIIFGALAMKLGNPGYTMIFFVFAGALAGFIPYNLPRAKIFGGSIGHLNYGFFLATMAIVSETKMVSMFMILALPLIDMLWVLWGRIQHNKLNSPLDLLSISDRTHLHHRLMNLGFSVRETLYIELLMYGIISLVAFYLGGFSYDFIILSATLILILAIFTLIGILYRKNWKRKQEIKRPSKTTIKREDTPEERYAY